MVQMRRQIIVDALSWLSQTIETLNIKLDSHSFATAMRINGSEISTILSFAFYIKSSCTRGYNYPLSDHSVSTSAPTQPRPRI